MADLSALIRLHKHELDEKRRQLGEMYAAMADLERQRLFLEASFEAEKEAMNLEGDVHFTFASYAQTVAEKRKRLAEAERHMEVRIELARDSMMETFSELKKYEMTQEERARLEAEERAFKEAQAMDAIGLEGFRRNQEEN